MIEIKVDTAEEQNYSPDLLETEKPIEIYVDQLMMALNSELGSIMGADVTLDLETFVFEMGLDEREVTNQVKNVISNFCSLYDDFQTEVTTRFAKGELRDICLIEIVVNKERTLNVLIK